MLAKFTALFQNRPSSLPCPVTDLSLLPAKTSKRLWVDPAQFFDAGSCPDSGPLVFVGRPVLVSYFAVPSHTGTEASLSRQQHYRHGPGSRSLADELRGGGGLLSQPSASGPGGWLPTRPRHRC